MSERMDDIKEMVRLFRTERYCFLVLALVSAVGVIGCALWLLAEDTSGHMAQVLGMMGSGGVVSFAVGSVYKFWSDAKDMYMKSDKG